MRSRKKNLKILWRNWENEQDYYSNYIDLLEETKRDYNEETYGYYSCDEGLINILMKEKYLKKLKMKKNMDLNFQMIKYLMKRNVLFWFRR